MKTTQLFLVFLLLTGTTFAQDDSVDQAAEMAKKLQDPLANITAIMTDNDFMFKTGQDEFSYSTSIQPVKVWSFDKAGFNIGARAIINIAGMAPESQKSNIHEPLPGGDKTTWGMTDMLAQFFYSPKSDASWKWGAGPMFSLKTSTDPKLDGPGWGSGPIGVLVGGSGNFSFAFIGGHLWGFNGNFSSSIFQPMIFYNFPNAVGWAVSYNNQISFDWKATNGNQFTVPLGLTASKVIGLPKGHGIELGFGPYWNVARPEGATSMMIRLNINFVFP